MKARLITCWDLLNIKAGRLLVVHYAAVTMLLFEQVNRRIVNRDVEPLDDVVALQATLPSLKVNFGQEIVV